MPPWVKAVEFTDSAQRDAKSAAFRIFFDYVAATTVDPHDD